MAIDYDLIDADIFDIIPNFTNKKVIFLAKDQDHKVYIFKPSWQHHHHNINEFISHYIGSLIGAPLLSGVFLKISASNMKRWHDFIKSFHQDAILPTFIPPYENAIFFAVEYKQDHFHTENTLHLQRELKKASNKDSFYSQYPLDQYLRNPDRHIENYLFYKEPHKLMFYLIDFDRIFNGNTNWSSIDTSVEEFECFDVDGYNKDLYPIVTNSNIRLVHNYACFIEKIEDSDINDMIRTISYIYGTDKLTLDKLHAWFDYRKTKIYEYCLLNEACFTSVTKRGLLSVNRQDKAGKL
jgi:hypothetical protein